MARYLIEDVDYGRDLNAKVIGAPAFSYWEFVSSETAVRNNIANVPSEEEWKRIELLAQKVLQPIREKLGKLRLTSGFRCKKLNDLVGSSDTSFHRLGCAADVEPLEDGVTLMQLLEEAAKGLYTEIIAEYFPHGWVHIGYQAGRTDSKVKLKDKNHKYAVVDLDYIKSIYEK